MKVDFNSILENKTKCLFILEKKLKEFCIIYCCVTNYPKTKWLKIANIYLTVSEGPNIPAGSL